MCDRAHDGAATPCVPTAVRDPEEAWQRHVGDSLALLPIIERHAASSLAPPFAAPPPPPGGETPSTRGERAGRGKRSGRRGQQQRSGWQNPGLGSGGERASASSDWWTSSSGSSGGAAAAASSVAESGSTSGSRGGGSSSGGAWSLNSLRVIDVGTGAGLPGMVLAISRPQWRVTLLDTLRKRCDFLQAAAERAGEAQQAAAHCACMWGTKLACGARGLHAAREACMRCTEFACGAQGLHVAHSAFACGA
eukprot:365940-Chlamydomonas_euryale.AAC.10